MRNWLKILIGLFIAGSIAAVLGYKFIYNKPHRNFEKATPDYVMLAEDLFNAYRSDKHAAEMKYNGKVLEITGTVNKVETSDTLTIAVFVMDEGMFGDEGIRCTMLHKYAGPARDKKGSQATIKGFLSGYNDTDVIMEKCSVIQ